MAKTVNPVWAQQDYAFYSDGTESGSTIVGTAGSQQSLDVDTIYFCRLAIAETAGATESPILDVRWQYNLAAGGWTDVGTTTPLQFAASSNVTDGGTTSDRIGGTGTFNAGRIYESANNTATVYTSSGNDHTEVLLVFTIDSAQVSNGQEILVRCVRGDGTVLDSYVDADIDVVAPVADALTADDLQSLSQLSTPSIGQTHAITADDLNSASQLSQPALSEVVDLLADNVQSASQLSRPALAEVSYFPYALGHLTLGTETLGILSISNDTFDGDALLADDLQSLSQLSTPNLGQTHAITADDLESDAELSTPALGQEHALTADDLQSASELSTPAIAETNTLTADDLESASELSTPAIAQEHAITADDLESASELSTPALAQEHGLLADDLQSASELSTPALSQSNILLADDLESASELSTPGIAQIHAITADDVQSASELSTPNLGQEHGLLADNLESDSELSRPALADFAELVNLLADNLQSLSQLSTPDSGQVHNLSADNLEAGSELSTPGIGQTHVLASDGLQSLSQINDAQLGQIHVILGDDLQSVSELSTPTLFSTQADNLLADDLESDSELSIPVLAQIHNLLADNVQSYSQLSRPHVDDGTEQPTTGGGVRRRDRSKIVVELPDGTIVEVDSREEAEKLLAAWYEQHGERRKPTLAKKKFKIKPYGQLPGEPELPKEEVTLYRPPSRRAPVSDERIHDAIVAQSINEAIEVARKRRIERKKRDEEEIIIIMSML